MSRRRTTLRAAAESAQDSATATRLPVVPGTPGHVPPGLDAVLRAPGQSLDPTTRRTLESHLTNTVGPAAVGARPAARPGPAGPAAEAQARYVAGTLPLRSGHELRGGAAFDFRAVRIHADADAARAARASGARALATGRHIIFNDGEYRPATAEGRALLAHELTHTVQQDAGERAVQAPVIQRVGLFESIARFFGGGTFSDDELQAYVQRLQDVGAIEDSYDSDNKAREVVRRWQRNAAGFEVLAVPVRILLIREMASGFLSGDDQQGILDLLEDSIPSELATMLPAIGIEALRARFDGRRRERLDNLTERQDIEQLSLFTGSWTLDGVQQILHRHGDDHIIRTILDQGIRIIRFDTAYDRWRYDDGREEELELRGLRGNRQGNELRIRSSLSNEVAASTLFHEVSHYTSSVPDYLEQEIQIRITQEEFNIRHGLPPVSPEYRNPDGTVNEAAIRSEIESSPHYNPVGRTRIGRRYEGEVEVNGWSLP